MLAAAPPVDVDRLRADTPGCERVAHLNNAGAALCPKPVVDAVIDYLHLESEVGGYEANAAAADQLEAARASIGRLIGADPADVALTTSDTTAWAKAFWGLATGGWFDGGGRILFDRITYNSHYLSLLQAADRLGVELNVIASTEDGSIDLEDLDRLLDGEVRLVTATHVATNRGLVNPVAAVGERARHGGVPFFLDACQSVGQLPVDVQAIGCAAATGTGRKFLRGPRGTGFLFAAAEWAERMVPLGIDAHSASWVEEARYELLPRAKRFEDFEASFACQAGLGVAADYALEIGIEAISARVRQLSEDLRRAVAGAGALVHDGGAERCGIVTFSVPGRDSLEVKDALAAAGVNVSVTLGEHSRLDMEPRRLPSAVRASPHAYNTEAETGRLVEVVAGLASDPAGGDK